MIVKNKVIQLLKSHRKQILALGVTSLILFGSVARNEAHAKSDIDFLVEFQGTPSFDQYMDLKFYLEDLLGNSIDLVTKNSLDPRLKSYVDKDAIDVT